MNTTTPISRTSFSEASFSTTSALALVAAAGIATLSGCQSTEMFTYRSTPAVPQTVTLRDTTSGATLWVVEVPVGQQLDVKFTERGATSEAFGSDVMRWTLSPLGEPWAGTPSELRVPPPSSRRLDVSVREFGEARQAPTIESFKQPIGTTMPGGPKTAPAVPSTHPMPAGSAVPTAPAATPSTGTPAPAIVPPDAKQPAPGQKPL
jgi:hypothetical protein